MCAIIGIEAEGGNGKFRQTSVLRYRERVACTENCSPNIRHPVKPLKPNDHYSGRTAPLTSKVVFYIFIQQIYAMNILNMVYNLRFFIFSMQFVS